MLDTIIIGSGPAGIAASIYASRAKLTHEIIEKEYEGTGQIANTMRVDNYPGLFGVSGYDLGKKFRQHALGFPVEVCENEVKEIVQNHDESWNVSLENGELHQTKTIIYCAGASHRKLGIPGEFEFYGKGVSNCALCDGYFYEEKDVAIIGGGNTALESAIYLANICRKVYLIHRRNEFRGEQILIDELKHYENIVPVMSVCATAIEGDEKVESVVLSDGSILNVQGVFVETGMVPNTKIIKDLEITDSSGYVIADETCETRLPGFYAAGDVRTKNLRQVVTAVSDGANAAFGAAEYIRRNA